MKCNQFQLKSKGFFFNEIIILSHFMYFDRDQSDFNWIRLN